MREVAIIGMGMTKFGKMPEISTRKLGYTAIIEAVQDSGIKKEDIQSAYFGSVNSRNGIGQQILMELGIKNIPVTNIENACASSSNAFKLAVQDVASGNVDVALAVGVEQLSTLFKGLLPLNYRDYEVSQGMILPANYALMASRFMSEYGITEEQISQVSVKNHFNGSLNEKAQYQKPVTLEEVMNSKKIADPLKLMDCCPIGDGASAAIVASVDYAHKLGIKNPVRVLTSTLMSGGGVYEPDNSVWSLNLIKEASKKAYEEAGVGPEDLDIVEVHDAYSIAELVAYEGLQLCEPGDSAKLLDEKITELTGPKPVNTSGGLLSKGHPLGATGISMLYELYLQLLGRAGERQVTNNPKIGLAETMGGGGITNLEGNICSIVILGR